MNGVIFHTLTSASHKIIKTLDVTNIQYAYYYKRRFNIFDRINKYSFIVIHDNPSSFSNSCTIVSYPTEQRCINQVDEINFKKKKLQEYVYKLQKEIIPISYENTMYNDWEKHPSNRT